MSKREDLAELAATERVGRISKEIRRQPLADRLRLAAELVDARRKIALAIVEGVAAELEALIAREVGPR